MDSKEKALELVAKKNAAEVLMIVLREEQRRDPELSHVVYKLTLEDAQVLLETIDRSRSSAQVRGTQTGARRRRFFKG